ncbi:protein jagged-1, partial [Hyalella azteca]|uniref:Protein jagged-1 n=1 Tax=Hyalella azteca TaxID=294128 RepID=A0A8B7NEJ3_HYAAZ
MNYTAVYDVSSYKTSIISSVKTNFSSDVPGLTIQCTNGNYVPSATELKTKIDFRCEPVCVEACQNGGKCVSPFSCECTRNWMGAACDLNVNDKCTENINDYTLTKATLQKDPSNPKLQWLVCETGFKIREDVFKAPIYCAGGVWVMEKVKKVSELGGTLSCLPNCVGGCNGVCHGNNVCVERTSVCSDIVVINGRSRR